MSHVPAAALAQNHHSNPKTCLQLQKNSSLYSTSRWLARGPQASGHWHLPSAAGSRPRVKTSLRTVLSGHRPMHAEGPTLCPVLFPGKLAQFLGRRSQGDFSSVTIVTSPYWSRGNDPQRKSVVSRMISLQSRSHNHTHFSPRAFRNPWSREWIISLGGFAEAKLPVRESRKV